MKKSIAISLLAVFLSSHSIFAQGGSARTQKDFDTAYDSVIRKTLETIPDIPGIAFVVIKDDKPVFIRAYGIADKESGRKANPDTLWYMGSSTKSFTALVAAMIDKEGKIKLTDPVTKYTADLHFKTPLPDKIVIRDLLTHTSGLNNSALVNRAAYTGQIQKAEIARVFAEGTTIDEANFGKYRYTNLGYNIYGIILENELRLKWQDELQKRIFDPADLKQSTAYRSRALAKKFTIAAPYVFDDQAGGIVRSVVDKIDNNMQAAGGHFMSIADLGKWLNLNMNNGRLNGKQVISADLMEIVHTGYTKSTRNEPPFSGDGEYGLGWQIGKYRAEKVIYHHGGYPGYRSHVSYMPDKKLAVGVLVNNDLAGGRVADMLAAYAYDSWLGTPNLETDYEKQLNDLAEVYERRKQQLISAAAERAKRASQLTQPLADYVGSYNNDLLGRIDVTVKGNTLAVQMGNLYCLSTPFTEKDTIRVVMIPGGNGETVGFAKGPTGKFDLLRYAGQEFKRIGP